jgi:Holliday junction resolvase-like predicted endonuclease
MPRVFDDWKENVLVFCEDAAIRWKAGQKKDSAKLRSERSEDALTWQFFRTLEHQGRLNRWASECLNIQDEFALLYWQRPWDQSAIDPDIDDCLARLEPIHRKLNRQHTETDLILRGRRTLIMTEVKLGYKDRAITGWRQAVASPVMPTYETAARSLISSPDEWKEALTRFAQLYKNLMLGQCLLERWSPKGSLLELHLLAIVNGATIETLPDGMKWKYLDELRMFCSTCSLDQKRLHVTTWQQLRIWLGGQHNADLEFLQRRMESHPLL